MIITELRKIQDRHGYIPDAELQALSERIEVPVYHLHGVASFYPHFRLEAGASTVGKRPPVPTATVHVCTDLPCHLRGAEGLLKSVKDQARGMDNVEVKNCSCLGQCDGAPAVMINDQPYARQSIAETEHLVGRALAGVKIAPQHFEGVKGPFKTDPYTSPAERYAALKDLVASGNYEGVVTAVKDANLRGMGGGGFPAHIKWNTVRAQNADQKYVICNADESEVGTFKDREILKALPHLLVEAMTIAGLTTGATRGFIYVRHEYHEQIHILEEEIARATSAGLLGDDVLGSGKAFHLEVFVSPGGYIQGEETALMEAIEGNRGQPRLKPCVPAIAGLWQKPTLINNVETYVYVPAILSKGAEWFRDQGRNGCQGLKWVGVGGHVNKPGVFEVPMGTTYKDIFQMAGGISGGRKLKAFAPSGPSFGFLPGSAQDVPCDFPDARNRNPIFLAGGTVGSAAIIAIAEGTDMVDLALNFTRFYRNESCGKCVPCRVGSQKIVDIITGVMAGSATHDDLAQIEQLSFALDMTSICGLGQVVSRPFQSVLKHWKDEVEAYLAPGTPKSRLTVLQG